jgi:hypothetical protein
MVARTVGPAQYRVIDPQPSGAGFLRLLATQIDHPIAVMADSRSLIADPATQDLWRAHDHQPPTSELLGA